MKLVLATLLLAFAAQAHATIDGPACGDLTKKQQRLLRNAALAHYDDKKEIVSGSIKAENIDCHDYDGVHSSSVFLVEWTQIDEDQEMVCSQEISVSVDYDAKKKLKTIDEHAKYMIENAGDVDCEN